MLWLVIASILAMPVLYSVIWLALAAWALLAGGVQM